MSTQHAHPVRQTRTAAVSFAADLFLPVRIALAMAAGLVLGRVIPGLGSALGAVSIHGTSLPIAAGLLVMMYPVLAKVRYGEMGMVAADRRMLGCRRWC